MIQFCQKRDESLTAIVPAKYEIAGRNAMAFDTQRF